MNTGIVIHRRVNMKSRVNKRTVLVITSWLDNQETKYKFSAIVSLVSGI